jgi:hypothetical protein
MRRWIISFRNAVDLRLLLGLAAVNIKEGTPIWDLCALQKWAALRFCYRFLREYGLKI